MQVLTTANRFAAALPAVRDSVLQLHCLPLQLPFCSLGASDAPLCNIGRSQARQHLEGVCDRLCVEKQNGASRPEYLHCFARTVDDKE